MSATKCHACGDELPPGARFCPSCGAKMGAEGIPAMEGEHREKHAETITCRNCGSINDVTLTYCESCGARLSLITQDESGGMPHQKRQPPEKVKKGKRRGKIGSWHIAVSLAVVAVILIVFYFMAKKDQDPAARLKLANELHDARKFPEAIEEYKNYLDLNPRDVDARVDMGICYFEMGDLLTARSEMGKGLSINPKHQLANFNLGIVSLQERNIEQARQWFEQTIAIDSTTDIAKRARMMIQQHSFPIKTK